MSTTRTTGIFWSSTRSGSSSSVYLPLLAVVEALQRRRGRAEHDHRAFHLAAHDGHVARVVARRFLLLVGVLVFLVHDDEPERFDRREDGRARADDDAGAALADLVPFVVAFAGGQMAVQHGDERLQRAGAEARLEPLDGLRRERDFRHEHDGALALFERVGDGLQINLGLAAAGDAVQEKGADGVLPGSRVSRVKRRRRTRRDADCRCCVERPRLAAVSASRRTTGGRCHRGVQMKGYSSIGPTSPTRAGCSRCNSTSSCRVGFASESSGQTIHPSRRGPLRFITLFTSWAENDLMLCRISDSE